MQPMNDRDDRDLLGTSDEDVAPRRENPYLKKKREKIARKEAVKAAPVADTPEDHSAPPADPDETDKPRRNRVSDFIFEHVKLITAIITMCAIISLVLITDVVGIIRDISEKQEQASREMITLHYVEGLTLKSGPITWGDLGIYRRNSMDAKDSVTWALPVAGTHYEVWISGVAVGRPPTYVYMFDMKTGDYMDLTKDDFDTFVSAHP
ncbi:MAG: hypothetical protein IIX90_05880 [Clostridia bacterium]|nr:hypothetical protein [Clostridia bacterium]